MKTRDKPHRLARGERFGGASGVPILEMKIAPAKNRPDGYNTEPDFHTLYRRSGTAASAEMQRQRTCWHER